LVVTSVLQTTAGKMIFEPVHVDLPRQARANAPAMVENGVAETRQRPPAARPAFLTVQQDAPFSRDGGDCK